MNDDSDRLVDLMRETDPGPSKDDRYLKPSRHVGLDDLPTQGPGTDEPSVPDSDGDAGAQPSESQSDAASKGAGNGQVVQAAASAPTGFSLPELLKLDIPPPLQLVEGLVEAGTLGTIAGLPESFKSMIALELGLKVSAGGRFLGLRDVREHGPVGYFWSDDSTSNAVARIRSYVERHGFDKDLPIRFYLNEERLLLPDAIPVLREAIEREGLVLGIFDSLYNFLAVPKMKDEDVAGIYKQIKAEVCDPTGCAMLTVDHAPWPTEGNRGQHRAYGSVFKAAAIRWGIYTERKGDEVWIEARGNNIAGLPRTLFQWDAEALELRPIESTPGEFTKAPPIEIATFVIEHGGEATPAEIRDHFEIADSTLRDRRGALEDHGVRYERDGRGSRYVADADNADPAPRTPRSSRGNPSRGQEPHGYTELTPHPATPRFEPPRGSESADLQGNSLPRDPAIPLGSPSAPRGDSIVDENELDYYRRKRDGDEPSA